MDLKASFQIQFLEKIGAPLIAVARAQADQSGASEVDEAGQLATLLGKTIEAGLGLSDKFDMSQTDQSGDSIRLALAALCAPLVAYNYSQTGQNPNEIDTVRVTKALEAILAFADNFTPAAENQARLEQLSPDGPAPLDENQAVFQYIAALTPAINAVSDFSFGQGEDKLMQAIAARLEQQAASLRADLAPAVTDPAQQKQAELKLLGALAALYAATHKAETARLSALDEAARAAEAAQAAQGEHPSLTRIGEQFDKRVAMIALLGKQLAPASATTSTGNASPTPPPETSPAQEPPPAAPMPAPTETAPVAEQQPQPQPQTTPPPATPEPEPETTPPPAPAEQPATPPSAEEANDGPYNPMSFFKPGAKPAASDEDGAPTENGAS